MTNWPHNVEPVRNDIECIFGILKKRFLFLKIKIRIYRPEVTDDFFMTYCAMHNVLLEHCEHDNWEETMLEDDERTSVQCGILEAIGRMNSRPGSSNQGGFARSQCRNNNEEIAFLIDINKNDDEHDHRTTNEEGAKHHARRDDLVEHCRMLRKHRALSLRRQQQ